MGWWTSAVALQGEAANHLELLRSRAVVVSVRGARRAVSASGVGQEGERERSIDDVSKSALDDIETGRPTQPGMSLAGGLLIGQVVSGMEMARAWSGLWCGTWEPVVPCPSTVSGAVWPAVVGGRESSKRLIREGLRTDAGHRGGPDRSSDEGPVMGLERRGRVILAWSLVNRSWAGGAG
jgi:hypothetical protein